MTNKTYEDVILPKWLTDTFSKHLPWNVISFEEGKFKISHDSSKFGNILEAYEYASIFNDKYQVVFDPSIHGHGGELMDGLFFCSAEQGAASSRLLISSTSQDVVRMLTHDYASWITEGCPAYTADPDNFFIAHQWLNYHPLFWKRDTVQNNFQWDTSTGIQDVAVDVWWNEKENRPGISLETGGHHGPDYIHYYADDRLRSYAPTYEEAIIMLAKKVNEFFDFEGNERKP